MEMREKRYEAKDDVKRYFADGGEASAVTIYCVTIPGANRQYVAVPHDENHNAVVGTFPSTYEEQDEFRSWDF